MPWALNLYDDPAAGVRDVLQALAAGLVDGGVAAEDIARFRVDVLVGDFTDDDYQATESRVWRQRITRKSEQGTDYTSTGVWYSQMHIYAGAAIHDYVGGTGDAPPKVTDEQMLDCRIVAACWAWDSSPAMTLYIEHLMFLRELPAIEAQGVSKSQRRRAKAPRKDEYKVIDWAEHARADIAANRRRNVDRGDAMKIIASNNTLTVRYVSKLATEMGWTGKKGRPKKPTK